MTHGDSLTETLRQKIIDGEFLPGARLSESALALQLEVSRNTLRESYRVLTEQGLLVHRPHRGVFVAAPTLADVVDIYRFRRIIECTAMRMASPSHPAVTRMSESVKKAEMHLRQADWLAIGSANMAFHEAIVSLADSPRLLHTYRHVAAELRLAFLALGNPRALHEPFVPSNRRVLSSFTIRGPEHGAEELDQYLAASERSVLAAMTRADSM